MIVRNQNPTNEISMLRANSKFKIGGWGILWDDLSVS